MELDPLPPSAAMLVGGQVAGSHLPLSFPPLPNPNPNKAKDVQRAKALAEALRQRDTLIIPLQYVVVCSVLSGLVQCTESRIMHRYVHKDEVKSVKKGSGSGGVAMLTYASFCNIGEKRVFLTHPCVIWNTEWKPDVQSKSNVCPRSPSMGPRSRSSVSTAEDTHVAVLLCAWSPPLSYSS